MGAESLPVENWMRIAVLSDIHGNLAALEAVLADLRTVSPDVVLHAGDLVANGSSPSEVIDVVRTMGWHGVHGNTDEMLWRAERFEELAARAPERHGLRRILFHRIAPATREAIGAERLDWLRTLPVQWTEGEITVVHASPADLWRAPLATSPDTDLVEAYGDLHSRIVVYGHIHRPFVRRLATCTVANTGSVSLSYDGDPRASYLVVDQGEISIRRVDYDIEREVSRLHDIHYPFAGWWSTILRTGRYLPPPAS